MTPYNPIAESYSRFGTLVLPRYFVIHFGVVPSKLPIYLSVADKERLYERVIELIGPETFGLQLVNKKWNISKNKNDKPEADHAYSQILTSSTLPLCLELETSGNDLTLEYFYDVNHPGLEDRLLDRIKAIRDVFGVERSPVFRILKHTDAGFETEKVNIDRFDLELDRLYNDDFAPVSKAIEEAITERQSGLILLYGRPGTGKTSYIKSLITQHVEEKFIFVPNDFVNELLKPSFITFLIRQRNAILVIEDAEKIITSREHANGHSVVSTILQLTDGLFSDYLNIKVVCTFNTDRSKIDKALLRKGRMIASYDFKPLNLEKTRRLLKDHPEEINKGMTLAEIFHINDREYPARDEPSGIGFRR